VVVCFVDIGGVLNYYSFNFLFVLLFYIGDCSRINKGSYIPFALNGIICSLIGVWKRWPKYISYEIQYSCQRFSAP